MIVCNAFQAGSDECSCGGKLTKGLCVKPVKGNAVLFWSMVSITLPLKEIIHLDYKIAVFFNILENLLYGFKIVILICLVLSGTGWTVRSG